MKTTDVVAAGKVPGPNAEEEEVFTSSQACSLAQGVDNNNIKDHIINNNKASSTVTDGSSIITTISRSSSSFRSHHRGDPSSSLSNMIRIPNKEKNAVAATTRGKLEKHIAHPFERAVSFQQTFLRVFEAEIEAMGGSLQKKILQTRNQIENLKIQYEESLRINNSSTYTTKKNSSHLDLLLEDPLPLPPGGGGGGETMNNNIYSSSTREVEVENSNKSLKIMTDVSGISRRMFDAARDIDFLRRATIWNCVGVVKILKKARKIFKKDQLPTGLFTSWTRNTTINNQQGPLLLDEEQDEYHLRERALLKLKSGGSLDSEKANLLPELVLLTK